MSGSDNPHGGGTIDPNKTFYAYPYGKTGASFRTPPRNLGFDTGNNLALEFLNIDGHEIADDYYFTDGVGGSNAVNFYKKRTTDGLIDQRSQFHNDMNFLIVPQNFDMLQVMFTAKAVGDLYRAHHEVQAEALMFGAFHEGGSLDYQRGQAFGVPANEIDLAAVDSASFMFGFTSKLAGISEEEAEKEAGKYNKIKNGLTVTGPYGMNPRDYKEFAAGYDFAREAENDPHSSVNKMMKAFGLGEPKPPGQSKPLAPRGRIGTPEHVGGQKHADNGDTVPTTFGSYFHSMYVGPESQDALAGQLNWVNQIDYPASSTEFGHAIFFSSFMGREDATGGELFALATRWFSGGDRLPGSRSFAPVGADVMPASSGSLWSPAKIAVTGKGYPNFAGEGPWRRSESVLGIGNELVRGQRVTSFEDGVKQSVSDVESRSEISDQSISQALNEFFMHQARLPPSGGSAFDPRLTPVWAGVKLPV